MLEKILSIALLLTLITQCSEDGQNSNSMEDNNSAPVARDKYIQTGEDIPVNIKLIASDQDNDPLIFNISTHPEHGRLTQIDNEKCRYFPELFYNGSDSFTFYARDGKTESNIATVTISIEPASDPPIAFNSSESVPENTARVPTGLNLNLHAVDPDGDPITFSITAQPQHGSITQTAAGSAGLEYIPDQDYYGIDSFDFQVSDGDKSSNIATIEITVAQVNFTPTAIGQTEPIITNEDVEIDDILLIAEDDDGDDLAYHIDSMPAHGRLEQIDGPHFRYIPDENFNGSDSFTFFADDGIGTSNSAAVPITVDPVYDRPVAKNDAVYTYSNTDLEIRLSGYDPDGGMITCQLETGPERGTLTESQYDNSLYFYGPDADYLGPDSFTFTVDDGTEKSVPATIIVEVTPEGIIFVDIKAAENGNGRSWAKAFNHPGDAIEAALSGDQIWVAAGRYRKKYDEDAVVIDLNEGTEIYGGFAGSEYSLDSRDFGVNSSILDGNSEVFHVVGGADDAVIDGFTITNGGREDGYGTERSGAGIILNGVDTEINHCLFSNNIAPIHGGAIYAYNSAKPHVLNSTFRSNSARSDGGAIYITDESSVNITESVFDSNAAGSDGGGVYLYLKSSANITGCDFIDNSAIINGGGLCNYGTTTVRESSFVKNIQGNRAKYGGGMMTAFGSTNIEDCEFNHNIAYTGGGGLYIVNAQVGLLRTDFFANESIFHGGGIYAEDFNSSLDTCNFISNRAGQDGAGIYIYHNSSPVLQDSLFQSNRSSRNGGGVYIADRSNPLFQQTDFIGNSSSGNGGGAAIEEMSDAAFNDCNFNNNESSEFGGAMFVHKSAPSLNNSRFNGNIANNGGALSVHFYASPTVTDCHFQNINQARESGGALYISNYAAPVFKSSTIIGSIADNEGGGIYVSDNSAPLFISAIILDNSAGKLGGGFYTVDSQPVLINCLIANNDDTGIYNLNSSPDIKNCTITGHTQSGIYNSIDSVPLIENSILWGNDVITDEVSQSANIVNEDENISCDNDYCHVKYSLVGEIFDASIYSGYFGNKNSGPAFAPDTENNRHYLLNTESPCIDEGSPDTEQAILDIVSTRTTRKDQAPDTDDVDMGFHY